MFVKLLLKNIVNKYKIYSNTYQVNWYLNFLELIQNTIKSV